jgi:hypothetical protein
MRKRIALAVAALMAAALLLAARHFVPLGRLGTGYAAELTCACIFVSGRTLDSCRGDLDPLAQKLVSIAVGSDDVRTSAIGVSRARATYSAATGCTIIE